MITLYRGDSRTISRFDVNKTSKNCLYGWGIYLTTDLAVARTYCVKGADSDKTHLENLATLANNMQNFEQAKALAFQNFALFFVKDDGRLASTFADRKKLLDVRQRTFKSIDINHYAMGEQDSIRKFGSVDARIAAVWKRLGGLQNKAQRLWDSLDIKVSKRYDHDKKKNLYTYTVPGVERIGAVTYFEFDKAELKHNVLDMQARLASDKGLCELLLPPDYPIKGFWHEYFADRYGRKHTRLDRARTRLMEYGYHGFSHLGGIATNSVVRHTVYILWDNDFVDAHRKGYKFLGKD